MKNLCALLSLGIALISQTVLAQVPKKMVVEHFTNTRCGICASRNPGLYNNLNNQSNVLHITVHPSSPYSACLLSKQNLADNDARTKYYNVYGGTPRIVINGNVIPSNADYSKSTLYDPYKNQTSPVSMSISQRNYGTDSIISTVVIRTVASHSLGNLSLFVALNEDTVVYTGSNGEPKHYDVFRKSMSMSTGMSVTAPSQTGDSMVYTFVSESNPLWNLSRIYTLGILQETNGKNLVQAEKSNRGQDITSGISAEQNIMRAIIFPNPVKNRISVKLQEKMEGRLLIYNLQGKEILSQDFNSDECSLNLQDVPAGIYVISIATGGGSFNQKFIKD